MYKVLSKDTIELEIVPYIPSPKRGFPPTVPLVEIVNALLYKLKTGVQWNCLPVHSLFSSKAISWQGVYYHFNKWGRCQTFKACWIQFLDRHRSNLDLSSVDLDGSHTPAQRGGQSVGYQGRKKRKTTNALYLTDRQGIPLAISEPLGGNHNDLYNIEVQFEVVTATLQKANIPTEGLFINVDAGFDASSFRRACTSKGFNANICPNKRNLKTDNDSDQYFDPQLYKFRYMVERTNAWIDSYRSLLNRFDTTDQSWMNLNYLEFIAIALKKVAKAKKSK